MVKPGPTLTGWGPGYTVVSMSDTQPIQPPRSEWERHGVCAKLPLDVIENAFFALRGRPPKIPPYMKYCSVCPVILECLNYAIAHDEQGVWGGTTENQRALLPRTFVKQLKQMARDQGWYEEHPSPEKILGSRMSVVLEVNFEVEEVNPLDQLQAPAPLFPELAPFQIA